MSTSEPTNRRRQDTSRTEYPDLEIVRNIVREAAQAELIDRFARIERAHKLDGSIVTEADLAMQARVRAALEARWPEYGFLGEEMPEHEQRAALKDAGHPVWCLDPLDGTSNYAAGIPYYSVSLALLDGQRVVQGVVFDPERNEIFSATLGEGAWCNDERLTSVPPGIDLSNAIACVDLKRLKPAMSGRLLRDTPFGSQRSFGSVALDWCWVAAGRFHVYLHGRQKLWDYAAGCLILAEAGGHGITLDGERVFRPALDARSAVAALDRDLFEQWCEWLGVAKDIGD
ncbi:MAG: inositol monophosphatase family protein [Chromatiales bacterium]|nr:inositol monophosphatase family protein [Chromatiales bacterium]